MHIICMSQHDSLDTGDATGLGINKSIWQSWRSKLKTCTAYHLGRRSKCGDCAMHTQAVGEDDDDSDDEDMPPLEDAK